MQLRKGGVEESRITVVYDGVSVPPEPARGEAILIPHTLDPSKGMALAQQGARIVGVPVEITKDLAADLPRARALVYLTYSEGLGSGILLGMAYGVTVIASNIGGVPELIRDGENGILVRNEPASVADAFRRIDPALGQAARKTVYEHFTEDHMIAATMAAYERAQA